MRTYMPITSPLHCLVTRVRESGNNNADAANSSIAVMMILQQGSKARTHVPTTQTDHCATAVGRVFPFSTWILLTGYTCPSRLSIEREREKEMQLTFIQVHTVPFFFLCSFLLFTLHTRHNTLFLHGQKTSFTQNRHCWRRCMWQNLLAPCLYWKRVS